MSTWRFFFENDDDSLKNLIRWRRFEILKSTFWTILNLLSWNECDENRSLRREHYQIFRCRHNITFDHAISLINWHDIENDCNDNEISEYRSFLTRSFRWLWQSQKIRWFDFRVNHENFCEKISSEIRRKFAWFLTIRIDKSYSCVATFCMNLIFCHRVCQMIWSFWCFVDLEKQNFFRHILRFFDVCWFESSYVFESFLRDFARNWKYFASCRWYFLFWRSKVVFLL